VPYGGPVQNMTEEELATLRRYKPAEVVQALNIPAKRFAT
jgi:hypothetical protein